MKTKTFCELIESAMLLECGVEVRFDTVPYTHDGAPIEACLGIFLTEEGVTMAAVVARAAYLLWQDPNDLWTTPEDKDEAFGDFADIVGGMHMAPYMQWQCAYFPGLTVEQVLAESETSEDPQIDPMDGSFVPVDDRDHESMAHERNHDGSES